MYFKYLMLIQLRNNRALRKYVIIGLVTTFSFIFIYGFNIPNFFNYKNSINAYNSDQERYVISRTDESNNRYVYDHDIPLIFIGGMPRSGTTLLRVLLDAHSWIRCGEETRVIPRILGIRQQWMKQPYEARRLQEAGITSEVLDSAVSAFILEVVAKHGPPAQRLCNKDPFTLRSAVYLKQLFPNSKFIFMIRDGRAVVYSIISRKITISGFDLSDFRQCMKKWNNAMSAMYHQCQQLGPKNCLPVYYEKLVLQPKEWLEKILSFLDVPWEDAVLHHEKLINMPGGISLSKLERSTDQVIKPINVEALTKWTGHIDKDVVRDMAQIAPMLATFGYDPNANPPDYGKPDALILNTMKELNSNKEVWERKQQEINFVREKIRQSLKYKNSITLADSTLEDSRSYLNQSVSS